MNAWGIGFCLLLIVASAVGYVKTFREIARMHQKPTNVVKFPSPHALKQRASK